jgi:hypothetical protein
MPFLLQKCQCYCLFKILAEVFAFLFFVTVWVPAKCFNAF